MTEATPDEESAALIIFSLAGSHSIADRPK
jgi:hypothetical protein